MGFAKYALRSRFLAFLAISCSIGAVAMVSGDALLLWVGVAGLAVGNVYMWRQRYAVSRVRTGVLLLLLLILLAYLGRDMLFSWAGDRVLLARYLVYGLIVSAFDLRTRRNVLGTMVLAGLLFVLLTEMAFDLWFPVLAGGFVLLALGAAIVDHVEEESSRAEVVGGGSWLAAGKVWAGFVPGFLLLSGALFLTMPRFGLGSLAQASWLPSRIDLTAGGPAPLPSRPSAAVSPEIMASRQLEGAQATKYVPLGYVGSAGDTPVMHVRSQVLSYWRGSTLDTYDGAGWLSSASGLTLVDKGQGQFVFPDSDLEVAGRRWYSQTYYLVVDQPNAVFTGYNPGRLYLPLTSQMPLRRGTIYRAVSPVPRLSPVLLRRDSVDSTDLASLVLPPVSSRIAALADSIVRGAPTDFDKAARLEQFLLRNYRYDLGVKPLTPGRDAVDVFLFEQQAGYCSQFATALAVMARYTGLPARVAVGYLPGVYNPMTGANMVRVGDAHAWVEIRFRYSGWVAFDPTPRPDAALDSGAGQSWVSFGLGDVVGGNFTGALSSLARGWSLGRLSLPGWTWLALFGGPALAGVLAALLASRHRARARRDGEAYTALAGEPRRAVLDTYRKLVALLVRKGLPSRQPAHTPGEYARLVTPRLARGREVVEWLTEAASTAAYDPKPFSLSTARKASEKYAALRRAISIRTR